MTDGKKSSEAGSMLCILAGLPAQPAFRETAALIHGTDIAASANAELLLHVFPQLVQSPFPITADTAIDWLDAQTESSAMLSSTLDGASRFVRRSGIDLVTDYSQSSRRRGKVAFLHLARTNDLTVLDAAGAMEGQARTCIEDALFDSGRPVLVVPKHCVKPARRRIAIAWDGSARSTRAVKDALPFLSRAEMVVAATVSGEKDLSRMAPGADLAIYLGRHGIDCKLATLAGRAGHAAERLRLFVAEEDIDMVVMGAFVHSRFREAVLGGVTRSFLDNCPLPLFMAH